MTKKFSLKDQLFNKEKVEYLASLFAKNDPLFNVKKFTERCLEDFDALELKQRITQIAVALEENLASDFESALESILLALPEKLDPLKTDDDFGDFIFAPLSEFIERNGCTEKYLDVSFSALREITMRFSVEFSIRSFYNSFPEETQKFMLSCAADENYHVRRLASEGSRPKLPWAKNINLPFVHAEDILDTLFADPTMYVRRSVANHMNDISKIDPHFVISRLQTWRDSGLAGKKEMDFILKHSLRTLMKSGHKEALSLLGYGQDYKIEFSLIDYSDLVKIGENFHFEIVLRSIRKQNLYISYAVFFMKKNGLQTKKVFHIAKSSFDEGQKINFSKNLSFRELSTRTLYQGVHSVEFFVNGISCSQKFDFTLVK